MFNGSWSTDSERGIRIGGPGEASASLVFVGNGLRLGYMTGSIFGTARVVVDGVEIGTIDEYAASSGRFEVSYTVPWGHHTLRIEHLGERKPSSRDTWINLDHVVILEAPTNTATATGSEITATPSPPTSPTTPP